MRKVISYIAISLDGKIAKPDGDTNWLHELPNPDNEDYGYQSFYDSVDAVIMGRKTYEVILGFGVDFPYTTTKNYVLSHKKDLVDNEHVSFVSDEIKGWLTEIRSKPGKHLWLVGGAQLNSLFLNNGLLDELRVYVMPIILGEGVSLFSDDAISKPLQLKSSREFNSGVIELIYELKQ